MKSKLSTGLGLVLALPAFASYQTVEVYCLDKDTKLSYGVSGDVIRIEENALIRVLEQSPDGEEIEKFIDLKKGECKIQKITVPDSPSWD